jgi:hypothetical protein
MQSSLRDRNNENIEEEKPSPQSDINIHLLTVPQRRHLNVPKHPHQTRARPTSQSQIVFPGTMCIHKPKSAPSRPHPRNRNSKNLGRNFLKDANYNLT